MSNPIFTKQQSDIELREVQQSDLDLFFIYQQDETAVYMAAFTAKDPSDRKAFDEHWRRIMSDEKTTNRTILFEKEVIGHVASFMMFGDLEVTYWIDRAYWGRGLATQALALFLRDVQKKRPIYGRAAKDNNGSRRVLEKCGFKYIGEDKGYANARGEEILEIITILEE